MEDFAPNTQEELIEDTILQKKSKTIRQEQHGLFVINVDNGG